MSHHVMFPQSQKVAARSKESIELERALNELCEEWDFIERFEVLEPRRILPALGNAVEAYRKSLKTRRARLAAVGALPFVSGELP
jgi:hypothetical protein